MKSILTNSTQYLTSMIHLSIFKICSGIILSFILMSAFTIAEAQQITFKLLDQNNNFRINTKPTQGPPDLEAKPWDIFKIDSKNNTIKLTSEMVKTETWRFWIHHMLNVDTAKASMLVEYKYEPMYSLKGNKCTLKIIQATSDFNIQVSPGFTIQPCDSESKITITITDVH
ncbi:hypothetical protein BH10PSE19_BH10PSE19_14740 [soil metagenome]